MLFLSVYIAFGGAGRFSLDHVLSGEP